MVKCRVIEQFTLKDFDKLQNIKRARIDETGKLFVNDEFECDEEMARYLTGNNDKHKAVVKIIEVVPEVEAKVEYHEEEKKPEVKITKKKKSKK